MRGGILKSDREIQQIPMTYFNLEGKHERNCLCGFCTESRKISQKIFSDTFLVTMHLCQYRLNLCVCVRVHTITCIISSCKTKFMNPVGTARFSALVSHKMRCDLHLSRSSLSNMSATQGQAILQVI